MKKQIIAILMLVFAVALVPLTAFYFNRLHIEQKVCDLCYDKEFVTYVWDNNKIVWSKYDTMEGLSDSIVKQRYQEAQIIVNAIKAKR